MASKIVTLVSSVKFSQKLGTSGNRFSRCYATNTAATNAAHKDPEFDYENIQFKGSSPKDLFKKFEEQKSKSSTTKKESGAYEMPQIAKRIDMSKLNPKQKDNLDSLFLARQALKNMGAMKRSTSKKADGDFDYEMYDWEEPTLEAIMKKSKDKKMSVEDAAKFMQITGLKPADFGVKDTKPKSATSLFDKEVAEKTKKYVEGFSRNNKILYIIRSQLDLSLPKDKLLSNIKAELKANAQLVQIDDKKIDHVMAKVTKSLNTYFTTIENAKNAFEKAVKPAFEKGLLQDVALTRVS